MAFRKITTISNAETGRSAVVYFDTDWREYRTCFATCGDTPKMGQGSDNHTDTKSEALETAFYWINNRADALGVLA